MVPTSSHDYPSGKTCGRTPRRATPHQHAHDTKATIALNGAVDRLLAQQA
jgi:hypothetical protein